MTLKPGRAIDLNISASLEFLARVIPKPLAPFHRSLKSGHLLEQQRLEKLPTKLKPDEERMARRLKLVHETRGRVNPKPRRRLKEVGGSIAMIKRSGCTLFRPTRCWSSGKCGEMQKPKIATKALDNRPATNLVSFVWRSLCPTKILCRLRHLFDLPKVAGNDYAI